MKANERLFYDKYLKEHAKLAEDAIVKGVGIGGGSKGSRRTLAGCEGQYCYSNICGKEGAVFFCHMNRQWYCPQCAEVMNHYASLAGLQPVCVTQADKCKHCACNFFDQAYDLNCSGWGLHDAMSPIECIRTRKRAKVKQYNKTAREKGRKKEMRARIAFDNENQEV